MRNDVIKKVVRALTTAFVFWGLFVILQGLPVVSTFSDLLRVAAVVVIACFIELEFGITPTLPLEVAIDVFIGFSYGLLVERAMELEVVSNISSQFSIPSMDLLLCLILVAFVAQLEVRSKSEKRTNRKATPRFDG